MNVCCLFGGHLTFLDEWLDVPWIGWHLLTSRSKFRNLQERPSKVWWYHAWSYTKLMAQKTWETHPKWLLLLFKGSKLEFVDIQIHQVWLQCSKILPFGQLDSKWSFDSKAFSLYNSIVSDQQLEYGLISFCELLFNFHILSGVRTWDAVRISRMQLEYRGCSQNIVRILRICWSIFQLLFN